MADRETFVEKLTRASNWREALDMGIKRSESPDGDEEALKAFETAEYKLGLNAKVDADAFLDMKRREAKLRFLRGETQEVVNAVQLIEANDSVPLPVWARLYRAAAMIQLDWGLNSFEANPDKLVKELSCVPEGDKDNLSRREAILLTALSAFTARKDSNHLETLGAKVLLDAAIQWQLAEAPETRSFRDVFAPDFVLPEPPPPISPEIERLTKELAKAKEQAGRNEALVKSLEAQNQRQTQTLKEWSIKNTILEEQASTLRTQNRMLVDEVAHVKELVRIPPKNNKEEIAALKSAVETLTKERNQAVKDGEYYAGESDKQEKRAESAEARAEELAAEIAKLTGQVQSLQSQCEELQRALRSMKSGDSSSQVSDLSENDSIDETPRDFVQKVLAGRRILVIADSHGSKGAIVENVLLPLGFRESDFDWQDDYAKLTNWAGNPASKSYCGILYGAAPHSMSGKGDANSLLDKIKAGQGKGFPKLVVMRKANQQMGLTVSSFQGALQELMNHIRQVA